jgi:HEPN domain-containing protein
VQNITIQDLEILSRECLEDAKALYSQKRYRGAIYNCGYAVEIGLKMKICKTLGWNEYRTDSKYKAFKTHELGFLLHLSGIEKTVSTKYIAEWSAITEWDPEKRYSTAPVVETDADSMIKSTETLLSIL